MKKTHAHRNKDVCSASMQFKYIRNTIMDE